MNLHTAKLLAARPLAWGLLAAVILLPLRAPAQTAANATTAAWNNSVFVVVK